MIKFATVAILSCLLATAFASRCKRGTRFCPSGDRDIPYDDCVQLCCGESLIERDVNLACCGNETVGTAYDTETEICCSWRFEYKIHSKANATGEICCGLELFDPNDDPNVVCCNGWNEPPQPFNVITEMCCDGVVNFAGDTAHTQCCGRTAFDRRVATCPCQNDVVYVGIPDVDGACCYRNGEANAYNRRTEACCGIERYNRMDEFCCGSDVGSKDTEICCGTTVVPINVNITEAVFACCLLSSGVQVAYNTRTSACCGGSVQALDPLIDQICCGGVLYNEEVGGSDCCGDDPYFRDEQICCSGVLGSGDACCGTASYDPDTDVCCGGEVQRGDICCNGEGFISNGQEVCCDDQVVRGDSCCGNDGYFLGNEICCQGAVFNVTGFTIPACCVNQTFDAYIRTCCGSTVFDNPIITDGDSSEVSHTTRCCGDFSDDSTLRPYDYFTQACCSGAIVDLGDVVSDVAECCGQNIIDLTDQLCCNAFPVDNPYMNAGECCDNVVINTDTTLCCSGVPTNSSDFVCCGDSTAAIGSELCCNDVPVPLGIVPEQNARCCGGTVYDRTEQICCRGVARDIGLIAPSDAACCGSSVIDKSSQICCRGQAHDNPDPANSVCCGTSLMNKNLEKCCDNIPRSLDNIPPEDAVCCGDGCIDGREYWCCDGKQYKKGTLEGADVSQSSCADVLPVG